VDINLDPSRRGAKSRDTSSLPIGAELLCPLRDGRSPYEYVCFDIPYTLWDLEEVALLLVACEIRKRRACGINEQEEVNWMIQHAESHQADKQSPLGH